MALPGAELYGSDRVARETVVGLLDAGHDVLVASPTDGPLLGLLRDDGAQVRLVPVPVLRKEFLSPVGLVRLAGVSLRALGPARRLLREFAPDVVVVNTVTVPMWAALARARRGRRLVVHVHEAETAVPRIVQRLLLAPLLLAHRVVVNSRFSLRVLTDSWARLGRRSVVVLNAVPGPSTAPEPAILHHPARLAYLGRISERKGVGVAVEAVGALRAGGVDVEFDLTGSVFPGHEPFVDDLRARITAAGLDDAIRFAGFAPDVWPVLAAADVVLMPSVLDEPFGNAAVEAVLAGRPLVASRQGGLVEATDGYAAVVLVPPADPVALATAIRTVLDDHPRFAAAAQSDARLAATRHAPATYRAAVVDAVTGAGR